MAKLDEETRESFWVMAAALESGNLTPVECVAYALTIREHIKNNGGVPKKYQEATQ